MEAHAFRNEEPQRLYTGVPGHGPGIVEVRHPNGRTVRLSHKVLHSPDGFTWGYGGSGPAELARSLLWDVMHEEPHPDLYHQFKWDVLALIPQNATWVLPEKLIRAYILAYRRSGGVATREVG